MGPLGGEFVAVAWTLAGAVVGVAGAARISRQARREALNDRIRDASGVYLGALYPAVAGLRELPDVDGLPILDQAVNRLRGDKATFIASRRRERQIFGDGMHNRAHGVGVALAGMQVLALPPPVRGTVDAGERLPRSGWARDGPMPSSRSGHRSTRS